MKAAEIKSMRATLGISQEQLAREVGVQRNAVINWEAGRHAPKGASAKALHRLRARVKLVVAKRTSAEKGASHAQA